MPATNAINTASSIEFRTNKLCYRIATSADDKTLRSILRQTPMTSWVSLSTEHEPSYFASTNIFGQRTTIICQTNDRFGTTVGMCSYTSFPVHINGNKKSACYLAELRVLPGFRHKSGIVKNGFRSVSKIAGTLVDGAHWFTSIASENKVARRLLEANLKGMPSYRPEGELVTIALSTRSAKQSVQMLQARKEDIPELVKFYNNQARQYQYSPVLSEDWLRNLGGDNGLRLQDFYLLKEKESVRACFAIWDQRDFKQAVVRGYRFPLNIMRLPYNLFAQLAGRVALPGIGSCINYVFIAFLAVTESAQPRIQEIIATALGLAKLAQAEVAMLGLSSRNPCLKSLDAFPKQTYESHIESVHLSSKQRIQDRAGLFSQQAIIQPEIALL
jgi:hypothetical protein